MHGSTSYDNWIPFKVHQLHHFLDITCKIGEATYTIVHASRVLHFKYLCDKYTCYVAVRILVITPISLWKYVLKFYCEKD